MRNCFLVLAACFLVACQPRVNSRGNIMAEENFRNFVALKTTKNEILGKCGSPSLQEEDGSWIYVGSKSEETVLGDIESTQRFAVKITFNENDILQSIEKLNLGENANFPIDDEIVSLANEKSKKAFKN